MKKIAVLLFAVALTGCQPNTDKIAAVATGQLQQRIDDSFGHGNDAVKVTSMTAVRDEGNKYRGMATITAYGKPIPANISILADREHVIYQIQEDDWKSIVLTVNRARFSALDGENSGVVISNLAIFSAFPVALQKNKTEFEGCLEVVFPIKVIGPFRFGSGCKAHKCGRDEAAWLIDPDRAKAYAITMISRSLDDATFHLYGADVDNMPAPLLAWAIKNGMTEMNSATQ